MNSTSFKNIERTEDLNQYEIWLRNLAKSDSSTIVFNDGKEYAAILFRTIFDAATKDVCIYCENMNGEVSETFDYYNALKDCKGRNVKVRVLLNTSDKSVLDHPIFNIVDKQTDVKFVTDDMHEAMKKKLNNLDVHFTVADGKIYRLEYDTNHFKAIASFNDEMMSKELGTVFDEIWNAA